MADGTYTDKDGRVAIVRKTATGYLITYLDNDEIVVIKR